MEPVRWENRHLNWLSGWQHIYRISDWRLSLNLLQLSPQRRTPTTRPHCSPLQLKLPDLGQPYSMPYTVVWPHLSWVSACPVGLLLKSLLRTGKHCWPIHSVSKRVPFPPLQQIFRCGISNVWKRGWPLMDQWHWVQLQGPGDNSSSNHCIHSFFSFLSFFLAFWRIKACLVHSSNKSDFFILYIVFYITAQGERHMVFQHAWN